MYALWTALLLIATPAWSATPIPGDVAVLAELPAGAEHRHAVKHVVIGKVTSDTLVHHQEDGWLAATVTTAPAFAMSMAGHDGVIHRARTSLLRDHDATETSWSDVLRDGRNGKRLTFQAATGARGISEIYTWDNVVITLTALVQPGARAAEVTRFFSATTLPR